MPACRTRAARRRASTSTALAATAAVAVLATPSPASSAVSDTQRGCVPGDTAKLVNGKAIAPCDAPRRVSRVIRAANEIAKGHGYCWGGGHGSFKSNCYDCSGAVSYALHGGGLLDAPLDSNGLARWGRRGRGQWITVFANSGHAYAKVAGLRFDTSMTPGAGPGWSDERRSARGFAKRHKGKL
jgi:cell wall-associated NlpC family hydrolase